MNLNPPPEIKDFKELQKWNDELYEFLKFPSFPGGVIGHEGEVFPEMWGPNTIPGTTDMTANIQAAIDSLTTGTVYFRNETYLISSAINPESYVHLKGNGTIKLAASSNCNMLDFTAAETDVIIEGLTFDGNGSNQARANTVNIIHGNLAIKRITIRNCTLKNSAYHSFWSEASGNEDIIIEGCRFYDYDATAIAFQYVTGGIIANNLLDNTDLTMTGGADAIGINYGDDIAVTGNRINMSDTASVDSFGIEGTNVPSNLTVTGNTIQCNAGTSNGGISLTHTVGDKNSVISGNSIYQAANIGAIEVDGANVTITGNTIQGTASGCSSIAVNGGNTNIAIVGNTILDYSGAGIDVEQSASTYTDNYSISIVGNTLLDSTSAGPGHHSIYFNASPYKTCTVVGNTIHNNANNYGIHLVSTDDSSQSMEGFVIANNSIFNCLRAVDIYQPDHSNHIVTGNAFIDCTAEGGFEGTNIKVKDNMPDTEVLTGTVTLNRHMASATIDSSGGAVTGTVGSGYFIGQRKIIVMTDATTSSTVSVTNHRASDPEIGTFDAVDEFWELVWTGTEWETVGTPTCTFL